ncbi:hypothetical protein Tco_1194695 [Tanacetum coccineum]
MLAPSSGGLILYQAYGNLYAMTGRKAHLFEDKQIPSVGVFEEVFCIWKVCGGNTRDLGSFEEETDKTTDLHQYGSRISLQWLETASQIQCDAVTTMIKMVFETYVKSKDLDLWHVIIYGDFLPIQNNPETKKDEIVPFDKQSDDLKKKLAKNNEAKMVIYNALPRKEYERIFMCKTAKEIWDTLLITHQGNSQEKDNKIDLLVQQYEQFTIPKEESIDNAFARFKKR